MPTTAWTFKAPTADLRVTKIQGEVAGILWKCWNLTCCLTVLMSSCKVIRQTKIINFPKWKEWSVLRQAPTLTSCVPKHTCMSRNCHPIPFQCQVINPPQTSVNPDLTLFHKMWLFFRFCVNARNWSLYVKGMLPTHRAQFKIGLI